MSPTLGVMLTALAAWLDSRSAADRERALAFLLARYARLAVLMEVAEDPIDPAYLARPTA